MPKYTKGAIVSHNGENWTVESWPVEDEGYALLSRTNREGGVVQNTVFVGHISAVGEQVHQPAELELVNAEGTESTPVSGIVQREDLTPPADAEGTEPAEA